MMKKKHKRRYGKLTLVLSILIAIVAGFAVNISKYVMQDKLAYALEKKRYAEHLYETELRRKEELEHLSVKIKTKKFIEDIARKKFGLAYENEIILEPENE